MKKSELIRSIKADIAAAKKKQANIWLQISTPDINNPEWWRLRAEYSSLEESVKNNQKRLDFLSKKKGVMGDQLPTFMPRD